MALIFCGAASMASAAGLRLIDIPASGEAEALKAAIWSPCEQQPETKQVAAFLVTAKQDCPVTKDKLPLIVISHGLGGTIYGHHDTAQTLADNGFLVVSLNHPGDSGMSMRYPWDMKAFERRPADISRVIDYMLKGSPLAGQIDASRIGVFGFSRGGFTSLVVAGAEPDFAGSGIPCPQQRLLCRQIKQEGANARRWAHDARVRAAAAVDPLNAFPTAASLKGVHIPLLLWISENGGEGVVPEVEARLPSMLPTLKNYRMVPNSGHFAFLAPCAAAVAKEEPEICQDAPGFDRAAFHQEMNAAVLAFFQQELKAAVKSSE
ncbi:alpha/beta fold hydrolase [Chromobacterium sp. IIBBL 290-4]|uniref:alpha/beta hydrolase family protein n=1 Tax=Chromobacterium sp. IIBBL 290-4 TaxID=2953890 RepID=UPI0020B6E013|nr:alpha/beta fold hydrolase [Chromobacterium sp. IIBBL 290-4]UTH73788.1 alpha/beta fold hydrolase [Chromobacterium sp. IIBBL 290-4]